MLSRNRERAAPRFLAPAASATIACRAEPRRALPTCTPPPGRDYTKFLNAGGLKGARIGVPRAFYLDRVTLPGETAPRGGVNAEQARVMAMAGAIKFQQSRLDISDEIDLVADKARYEADHAKDLRLSREQGIDAVLRMHKLDAIITPGGSGAGVRLHQ